MNRFSCFGTRNALSSGGEKEGDAMREAIPDTYAVADESAIRVLVVDDDPVLLESTGRLMVMRGFCPHTVDSGWKAISLVEKNAYDAILLDLWMPNRNGLETLERIRCVDRNVTVIATSGMGTTCTVEACERVGILRFLPKPIRASDLYATIEEAAARTRSARAAIDADSIRGSVLLADDHDAFRSALAHRLRIEGFRVEEASSGEQAAESWRKRPCDVALLDVHMPHGSGVWAAETIHSLHPGAAIAFMTGEATNRELHESARHTAGVCLTKPLEFEKISHVIEHLIEVGERTRKRQISYDQYQNLSGLSRSIIEMKKRLRQARRSGAHRILIALITVSFLFSIPIITLVDRMQRDEIIANGAYTRSVDSSRSIEHPTDALFPSQPSRERRARELAELLLSKN